MLGFVTSPSFKEAAAAVRRSPDSQTGTSFAADSPAERSTSSSPEKPPTLAFQTLKGNINSHLYDALTGEPFNFTHMSPVQEAVLEHLPDLAMPIGTPPADSSKIRAGSDLLVKAKTGTGKTIAFLVPAIEARLRDIDDARRRYTDENPDAPSHVIAKHVADYRRRSTGVLILSPTRELATQIANEAIRLCSHLPNTEVRLFVGGSSKYEQLRQWSRGGRDIVVATPGRMYDLLQSKPELADCIMQSRTLILDEADTLLEMGFKEEIDRIVTHLRPQEERQTFLFSATVSPDIKRVAARTMKNSYRFIDCVPEGESSVHEHIPQHYTVVPNAEDFFPHMINLIAHDQLLHPEGGKAIIFLPTTRLTQLTAKVLIDMKRELPWGTAGTSVYEIHGQKEQEYRSRTAAHFRRDKGGYSILCTSDVSARGVDYPGVTRVIQIGIPNSPDIYVHRVGRTGRAGKSGRGDLILSPWEIGYVGWRLDGIPLKALPMRDAKKELDLLVQARDESTEPPPTAPSRSRDGGDIAMSLPLRERIDGIATAVLDRAMPRLDDGTIKDAFASMVGYYMPKAGEMRTTKDVVLQGLKDWAVGALGLGQEPYLSPAFLMKVGFNDNSNRGAKGTFFRNPRDLKDKTFERLQRGKNIAEGVEYGGKADTRMRYLQDYRDMGGDAAYERSRRLHASGYGSRSQLKPTDDREPFPRRKVSRPESTDRWQGRGRQASSPDRFRRSDYPDRSQGSDYPDRFQRSGSSDRFRRSSIPDKFRETSDQEW